MVTLSSSVALSAAVAAATMALTQASPLQYNPYTPVDFTIPLTPAHPAFGGKVNGDCIEPIVPEDPNEAVAESMTIEDSAYRKLRNMEDASNSDVNDLEKYFGTSMELSFTTLKEQYGSASAPSTPWASSYWATFQDGINNVWKDGEPSAAEKYANAFGLDATDFMNQVSSTNGIDAHKNTPCSSKSDCASTNDGSECAKREGESTGYCIPTWWGICHAWAPASILEQEPQCDVEKNGITFHVMDIKALLTEVYAGASLKTVFTGARFDGADSPASTDQYGRYTNAARRDLGPGYFHIAISNIMGKQRQSFVVDVTAGNEVWNQPIRSYEVQTMEIVDVAEASQQYFGISTYPFNSEMVYLAYVKTTLSWISESYTDGPLVSTGVVDSFTVSEDYEYLLELDASYNVIGGEWVGSSKQSHPDFLWFPTGKPAASVVTSVGLSYADVQELLEMSLSCNSSTTNAPTSTPTEIPEATTQTPTDSPVSTPLVLLSRSNSDMSTAEPTSVPSGSDDTGVYIPITLPPSTDNTTPSADNTTPSADNTTPTPTDSDNVEPTTTEQSLITPIKNIQTLVVTAPDGKPTSPPTTSETPVVTPPGGKPMPFPTIPILPPSGNPSTPGVEILVPSVRPASSTPTPDYPETPSTPPTGKQTPAPTSPMVTPPPTESTMHFVC